MSARPEREGGIKVVFDVPTSDVEHTITVVGRAGFDVRRYYSDGAEHGPGRAAAIESIRAEFGLRATIVGVDTWGASGGDDGWPGVREPRRPVPWARHGRATASP